MSEEGKKVKRTEKVYNVNPDISNYKHHKEGRFTCESEVEQDGKIICCLHDPITGEWKWPVKGDN